MSEYIRAVVVSPGKPAVSIEIETGLESLQTLVDGLIQVIYPYNDNVGLVCNDEGKLLGLPMNRALKDKDGEMYDVITGNFLIVGLSEDDFCSLTPEQEKTYLDMYKVPERFERRDGKIVAIPIERTIGEDNLAQKLMEDIKKKFESEGIEVDVEISSVEKVQTSYDAVTIRVRGEDVGICLDLGTAEAMYRETGDYDHVLNEAYEAMKGGIKNRPTISQFHVDDYSWVKDKLGVELINRDRNISLLEKVPHTCIEDLAAICRIRVNNIDDGMMTTIVTNDLLEEWGIGKEQLFKDAIDISSKSYPLKITSIQEILFGKDIRMDSGMENAMYVCNAEGMPCFGAGAMFYPDFGEKAAEKLGSDFYIIPSSRHEVILVPEDGRDPGELCEMVKTCNAEILDPADFLSDNVYRYNAEDKKLTTVKETKPEIQVVLNTSSRGRGR